MAENENGDTPTLTDEQIALEEDERKIFVGGLDWEVTEDEMGEYFAQFGEVEKSTLKKTASRESRGFGFVTFKEKATVDTVLGYDSLEIGGKKIGCRRAKAPGSEGEPVLKVFVGGVEETMKEETIREYFSQYGEIQEIIFAHDSETNERKPFCFVKYNNEDIVDYVITQNDSQGKQCFGGKEHDVKKHRPKAPMRGRDYGRRPRRGMGYGGPGFRGAFRGYSQFGSPYGFGAGYGGHVGTGFRGRGRGYYAPY